MDQGIEKGESIDLARVDRVHNTVPQRFLKTYLESK